ncbi:hypothetical protein N9917_00380 [Deltaproteobacteria bacterium]|nr:hypothetical protein [Deltaproteobacteria bacterium]
MLDTNRYAVTIALVYSILVGDYEWEHDGAIEAIKGNEDDLFALYLRRPNGPDSAHDIAYDFVQVMGVKWSMEPKPPVEPAPPKILSKVKVKAGRNSHEYDDWY